MIKWLRNWYKARYGPKTYTINVTQEHIDEGIKHVLDSTKCVIALAIKDAVPEKYQVNVGVEKIYIHSLGKKIALPKEAQVCISDAIYASYGYKDKTPKPFSFQLTF